MLIIQMCIEVMLDKFLGFWHIFVCRFWQLLEKVHLLM